jgi:cysteine desulfurase
MSAYLDWAASAPAHPLALEAARRALEVVGNPSSAHGPGRRGRDLLERAREQVASLAGCHAREVIFTGSGTEANALAVIGGFAAGGASPRLALSTLEHPSVHLAASHAPGAEVVPLPSGPDGVVDLDAAAAALAPGARLVAVQAANNETGAIQPVRALAALAAEAGALFHCDAVQAAGKVDLHPITAVSHTLSLSAHKLGGLAGAGALVVKRGIEPLPVVPGHQEGGLRGGTHPLVAIAAFGAAATEATQGLGARRAALAERTEALERILRQAAPDVRIQSANVERVGGIVNATFPGVDGETLLVSLDLAGVACSHGAACSTGAMEPSHVLLAMGLPAAEARSTLRFSVGATTTDAELAHLAAALPPALAAAKLG